MKMGISALVWRISLPHNNHIIDGYNKDIGYMGPDGARDYYLELTKDWEDPYGPPVETHHDGVRVVRDDLLVGSKVRGADCLVSSLPEYIDTLVYVQPRTGLAGVSLLDVAKNRNMKVRLFMPACKTISEQQACCIERGAEYTFYRIARMPNLNRYAKQWCDERKNVFFVPPGLNHELVTAGIVKVASKMKAPDEVYCATSTGVLTRGLQIAWPDTKFTSVCVARNMKAGELGKADPISEPLEFTAKEKDENLPPFPCMETYDAKVWKYIPKNTGKDILFWNVGKAPVLTDDSLYDSIDGWRQWGEKR
jgi:hypothetical protein